MHKKRVRNNGLQFPLHWLQVLSWILTCLEIIFVSVFLLTHPATIPCIFIYLLKIISLFLMLMLSYIDPTAPTVDPEYKTTKCSICCKIVKFGSKHCGQCNRCTEDFDHHCKWLNNCIGSKNYKLFIVLVAILNIDKVLVMIFAVDRLIQTYQERNFGVFAGLIVLGTENCCVLGFSLNLLGFHIYLKATGMTTYQYLVRERDRKKGKIENNKSIKQDNMSCTERSKRNEEAEISI